MNGHASPRIAALGTLAAIALLLIVPAPAATAHGGAAPGGARYTVRHAAVEHPDAGPLALGSAVVAAGAGTAGFALLRRRRAEDAGSDAADGHS